MTLPDQMEDYKKIWKHEVLGKFKKKSAEKAKKLNFTFFELYLAVLVLES